MLEVSTMKILVSSMILLLVISCPVSAMELDNFSISITIYPQKLPDNFENGWFVNDKEWLSISVDFAINIYKGLYTRFNTKTFIFGTNGFSFAPSSTKFISELGYKFKHVKIRYHHYCHHYFHQFENNYSDSDKLLFEY